MPPESSAWDRKDSSRERKHERAESLVSASRWKDHSMTSVCSQNEPLDIALWESSDFGRPLGHRKRGGRHPLTKGPGHGFAPLHSGDRVSGCENLRSAASCSGRNNRDEKSWIGQKEWIPFSGEAGGLSGNTPGSSHDVTVYLRPAGIASTFPSTSHSELESSLHQTDSAEQRVPSGLKMNHQREVESSVGSVEWESLKWSRTRSLTSSSSKFSLNSSVGVDSCEEKIELQPQKPVLLSSPLGGAAACVTSFVPSEPLSSRKKPRLGWGEGLAKYEKKKVYDSDGKKASAAAESPSLNLSGSFTVDLDCASLATASLACNSSPDVEEKSLGKTANADNAITKMCPLAAENYHERFPFDLKKLDECSMANASSLDKLIRLAYNSLLNSSSNPCTAINKLLVWKVNALKELESTESEIDLLEDELKMLKSESGSWTGLAAASSSCPIRGTRNLLQETEVATNLIPQCLSLEIDSCTDRVVQSKFKRVDSAETVITDPLPSPILAKAIVPARLEGHEGSGVMIGVKPMDSVVCSCEVSASVPHNSGNSEKGESFVLASATSNLNGNADAMILSKILASNKESARKAGEVLGAMWATKTCDVHISDLPNNLSSQNDYLVKKQIAKKKKASKIKERVLAIKFRALWYLWKEDVCSLSMRKSRPKLLQASESSLHTTIGGCKKRSPMQSRYTSPASILSLVSAPDVADSTCKLLSGSIPKVYRGFLKMPMLVLDKKEQVISRFVSRNGLVEDPCAVEKERAKINPWTAAEGEVFMDKLATYGKNFRKIASFLDHKTTADCVQFYYKNHKSDCFENVKKKLPASKQGKQAANKYLVTTRKKWNGEMEADSLDMLGAVAVMAAHAHNISAKKQSSQGIGCRERIDAGLIQLDDDRLIEKSGNLNFPGRETSAVDLLAGICGSLSSDGMDSCITSSADPGEGCSNWKQQNARYTSKCCSLSDITQNSDSDSSSDESSRKIDLRDWSDGERSAFIQAISSYGRDFEMISRCVRTRSEEQCKVFFSKARKCLGVGSIRVPSREVADLSSTDDEGGGGSGTGNTCGLETGSVICNDNMENKIDRDLKASPLIVNKDGPDEIGSLKLKTDSSEPEDLGSGTADRKGVFETVVSNECETEEKPEFLSEDCQNSMGMNYVESQLHSVQQSTNNCDGLADTEDMQEVPTLLSSPANAVFHFSMPEAKRSKSDSERTKPFMHETDLNKHEVEKCAMLPAGQATYFTRNTNHQDGDTNFLGFSESGTAHQASTEVDFTKKSLPDTAPKKLASLYCKSPGSAVFRMDRSPNWDSAQGSQTLGTVDCNRQALLPPQANCICSNILPGYSLQILTMTARHGDSDGMQLLEGKNTSTSDVGMAGPCSEFYRRKCVTSTSIGLISSIHPVLSHNGEKHDDPRAYPCASSEIEKPCKSGDIKLFGKVLTSHESSDKGPDQPREDCRPSNSKRGQCMDGNLGAAVKLKSNNQPGPENVLVRSYGFRDGNRTQTGLSSLPYSTIPMAKCTSAFSNYYPNSIPRTNEHNLNRVSVYYPPRHAGVAARDGVGYQTYKNNDRPFLGPFVVGVRSRQRGSFEEAPSLPQQRGVGGMMLAMNIVQARDGLMGSSPCTAVSDPMAAIKLHHAKAGQHNRSGL